MRTYNQGIKREVIFLHRESNVWHDKVVARWLDQSLNITKLEKEYQSIAIKKRDQIVRTVIAMWTLLEQVEL